jgi:geranylgeranylglycerol-phosphate geranylgeranyltransferase
MTDRGYRPLLGYFRLVRPANAAIAFASVLGGGIVTVRSWSVGLPVFRGALAAALILGAGNALNDVFDAGIDAVNRPDRPVPSGSISSKGALALSIVLFAGGIGLAWTLSSGARAIAVVNSVLLAAYARYSKRMPVAGNILVAALTASVFPFSGAILGRVGTEIAVLAVSAFFAMLAREILKDIEDLPGDEKAGAATIPTRWGVKAARTAATVSSIAAVLPLLFPALIAEMGLPYLIPAGIGAAVMSVSLFLPAAKAQRAIKGAILLVLLAFLAGSL